MRTGDIRTPSYMTKEQYVANAAEEIDAALGHLYVSPFVIDATVPANRPTILFLKKVNWLLASGRFILDVAAAGEMDNLNAYGRRLLDEANAMLAPVIAEDLVLTGAEQIDSGTTDQKAVTGPMIHNEDSVSLVQQFYTGHQNYYGLGESIPALPPQVVPYG